MPQCQCFPAANPTIAEHALTRRRGTLTPGLKRIISVLWIMVTEMRGIHSTRSAILDRDCADPEDAILLGIKF